MTDWDEIERKRYTQSGKGAGEFGSPWQQIENNPDNPYQKGQGNKSPSPHFKKYLDTKPKTPSEPERVEAYENEGGFIPPDPETNNKYEREVEERPRWKNAFGEVITPAEKAALKRDQDKKEVKEQLEKAGVYDKTDPRDVFWESVKDTGVSQKTVAVMFDQLVQKRKYGMTDDEIGTEIKQALLGWIRSKKAPKATPNLKSQQRPQIIIRPRQNL